MTGRDEPAMRPEWLELAALYALDALDADEAASFERELARSPELRVEVDQLREIAGSLGAAAALEAEPPPGLRDRVLAGAKPGVLRDRDGLLILRAGLMDWKAQGLEGVSVKVLHHERETGRVTSLVSFKAGAVYPGHRHAMEEELFVVEGTLEVHGIPMGPGDYCRAQPGSEHRPSRALTDAVVLVRNSMRDEIH